MPVLHRIFLSAIPRLVREGNIQAGCDGDVVPLDGRIGRQRMVVEYIRQCQLPAEPLVELGDEAEVE